MTGLAVLAIKITEILLVLIIELTKAAGQGMAAHRTRQPKGEPWPATPRQMLTAQGWSSTNSSSGTNRTIKAGPNRRGPLTAYSGLKTVPAAGGSTGLASPAGFCQHQWGRPGLP